MCKHQNANIDKKLNSFSDSLNHALKTLEVSQNGNTDLLKENAKYLKKERNAKGDLIKFLIDTLTTILDTVGKSKIKIKDIFKLNQVRFSHQRNRKTNLATKIQYMLETLTQTWALKISTNLLV